MGDRHITTIHCRDESWHQTLSGNLRTNLNPICHVTVFFGGLIGKDLSTRRAYLVPARYTLVVRLFCKRDRRVVGVAFSFVFCTLFSNFPGAQRCGSGEHCHAGPAHRRGMSSSGRGRPLPTPPRKNNKTTTTAWVFAPFPLSENRTTKNQHQKMAKITCFAPARRNTTENAQERRSLYWNDSNRKIVKLHSCL